MKEINEAKKNPRITRYPFASGFHPTLSSCLRQNVSQTNDRTEKFDFLPSPLFPLLPRIKTFPFRWELSPRSSPSKNRVSPSSLHRGASSTVVGDSSRSRTGFCACKYAVVRASWLSRQYSTRSQGEERTLGFYSRKNEGKTEPKPCSLLAKRERNHGTGAKHRSQPLYFREIIIFVRFPKRSIDSNQ